MHRRVIWCCKICCKTYLEMQKTTVTNAFSFCCWPLIGETFFTSVAFWTRHCLLRASSAATVVCEPNPVTEVGKVRLYSRRCERQAWTQHGDTGRLLFKAQSRPTVGPKIAPEWKSSSWVFFKICQTFCSVFILNRSLCCVNGLWLHILKTLLREGAWGLWCMW